MTIAQQAGRSDFDRKLKFQKLQGKVEFKLVYAFN